MAIYSVNQVRHLYVAKTLATSKVTEAASAATIRPVADNAKSHLYFEYKGATDLMRSDLIPIKNVMYAKATPASKLGRKLMGAVVALDSSVSAAPVAGQDYILNINIRQYIGMSDKNIEVKYGAVRAYKNMTASQFYVAMAKSLALNFKRELAQLFKFYVVTSSGVTEVTPTTDESTLTGTYIGVGIREVEQEWILGVKAQEPVYFDVHPSVITVDGDERQWGKVTTAAYGTVGNGKEIADLEYFCLGDRGDVYRNVGFPQVMNTQYLVDSSVDHDVIDIHYCYIGDNENPQKSEKDITIVVPNADGKSTLTNSIISAINTASGLSIATITVPTGGQ